ncbi:MAG: heme-binding protein [Deltaproteobacteria bacterium]|nr:heme-binding protein [Deltaproteobacteria bacterium]
MPPTQEPPFTSQLRDGDFEVRRYEARTLAKTQVEGEWSTASNEGFRRLAGFIFGKNHRKAKIAMTAPVGQQRGESIPMTTPVGQRQDGTHWTVSFTMPAGESLATLPEPDDARVTLEAVLPVTVAVVRFSGTWTPAHMRERTEALREWVAARGLRITGEPEVNRYDPPFKPWFLRRNEVWLPVDGT